MSELLKRLPDEQHVLRFLSRYKSVDRYYWQQIAPRMHCYAASPLMVFQRDDFSDIQQADARSNQQQARQAFDQHLIDHPTTWTNVLLTLQGIINKARYQIDGTRRALLKPIQAK